MLLPECHTISTQYRISIIQAAEMARYLFNLIWMDGFEMICVCAFSYIIN